MPTIQIGIGQIREAVEQLNMRNKIELVKILERETLGKRIDELLKKIDIRRKKHPISHKEILNICEQVRKSIND